MPKSKSQPTRSFWIVLLWVGLAYTGFVLLHTLPKPIPETDQLVFSEGNCRKLIKTMAHDIGMRVVGTKQETETFELLWDQLSDYKSKRDPHVQFDLVHQQANGSHLFDFMSEQVVKVYQNISNIIVHLTCETCSKDAILLNSHYDTTIVSPGAADDGAGVAIMMEMVRLFSKDNTLKNSIIFLFNGAEETLQDASHAFVTQHNLSKDVKAVINLEAMGARGKEILFQANSRKLIDAYAHVPHPHASSLSNDIFGTGLILSDTDFRQFVEYGNLVGLDFAFYQNSYSYHTTLDVVENIQSGSLQHFGDNIYALLKHLLDQQDLHFEKDSSMIYYVYMDLIFVAYSKEFSQLLHLFSSVIAIFVCLRHMAALNMTVGDALGAFMGTMISILLGFVTSVGASLLIATVNPMSWFSNEMFPLLLFGPTFVLGLLLKSYFTVSKPVDDYKRERQEWIGLTLFWIVVLLLTTLAGIASSFVCLFNLVVLVAGLLLDYQLSRGVIRAHLSFWVYVVCFVPYLSFGFGMGLSFLYVFVPIAGRIGPDAPVDVIVPIVTSLSLLVSQAYIVLPLSWRLDRHRVTRLIGLLSLSVCLVFAFLNPYTPMAPKRVYVGYKNDQATGEHGVHVAFADIGNIQPVLKSLENALQVKPIKRTVHETELDWSTMYPFSHFIENHFFNLTSTTTIEHMPVLQTNRRLNSDGTQTIDIICHHEHFIWTVIAFSAEIESWSLSIPPPTRKQHKIRHVSGDVGTEWTMTMTVKGHQPITFNVNGLERNGYNLLVPNSSKDGMQWIWSDSYTSGSILAKVERSLPRWTSGMYVGMVSTLTQ
ncbi:hypothetical protein EDD86DRAFT_119506 [Gorgonomyces haynaldii]|nr:hypothetical protein EDD86DRAFT_119506 [Gorgonomyces haynaldii]